jgi:hypothetical protein
MNKAQLKAAVSRKGHGETGFVLTAPALAGAFVF